MRRIIRLCAQLCAGLGTAALLNAAAAQAEDAYAIKVYEAHRAGGAVVLDGRLDEPDWRAATVVSGFTHYDGPELADPQTQVRITYDDEALYFGVQCDEPLMDSVRCVPAARDSKDVFRGETVEVFLDPGHTHQTYYQFAVSCAGSIYDSRITDRVWNANVRAATHLGKDSWSLEVAIPWSGLSVDPGPGALLGFNVCRDRQVGDGQWTTWTRVKANFHDPVRFAHLLLSPAEGMLAGMQQELRKGDRRGPIQVYTPEGFSGTTYRSLASAAVAGLERSLAELKAVAAADSSAAERRELVPLIRTYAARIQPLRETLAAPGTLDAATWYRMALARDAIASELGGVIWQARLRALLSRI